MTLEEYHAALNRLVTDTFGVGRREWRYLRYGSPQGDWSSEPLYMQSDAAGYGWEIATRLAPLDFCTSLDAVRQVEEAVLTTLRERCHWQDNLDEVVYREEPEHNWRHLIAIATAEQRVLALLRLRNVVVPERPEV